MCGSRAIGVFAMETSYGRGAIGCGPNPDSTRGSTDTGSTTRTDGTSLRDTGRRDERERTKESVTITDSFVVKTIVSEPRLGARRGHADRAALVQLRCDTCRSPLLALHQ